MAAIVPMSEFLSRSDVGLYALKPEDCAEFGATMEKGLRKRHKRRAPITVTTKVWAEHWMEAASRCGDAPFRIWLTPDSYVVLQRVERTEFYTVKLTQRIATIDTVTRPPASIASLAADVSTLILATMDEMKRTSEIVKIGKA